MAIKFDETEEKPQQIEVDSNEQKPKKSKKEKKSKLNKPPLQRWTIAMFVLSIIAVVYALTYTFSGMITFIPVMFLWLIWTMMVVIATVFTIGAIWFSPEWKGFSNRFMEFNKSFTDITEKVTMFMYQIFPYLISAFGACVVAFLTLSIIGFKKQKDKSEGFKGKLIWSIVLTVIFVALLVFDVVLYVKSGI